MKLLTKLNTRYIIWSLVVMAISGAAIYFTISVIINKQMDERLTGNLQIVVKQLAQSPGTTFFEPDTEVKKIKGTTEIVVFSDTLIFNEQEQELEDYRQISAVKNIGENYYRIVIQKSKIESEDLLATLALVTLLGMILLWLILLLVNRRVAKSVWQPFFTNLKIIEQFSVGMQQPVQLGNTGISEFDQLNEVVTLLTRKIISDYQNLKQFTEDASHEMQTPLAVIRSKLETFLNGSELTQKQTGLIHAALSSVNHLARLNKSLILLAKIDNKTFTETTEINFTELINEKLNDWQELLELKNIQQKTNFQDDLFFKINPDLAEIFVSNLLSNAIKHNVKKGLLIVETNKNQVIISNTGEKELSNPKDIFKRFYKENSASNSVGLGLAIVKNICDNFSISIHYSFKNNLHTFTLTFPK